MVSCFLFSGMGQILNTAAQAAAVQRHHEWLKKVHNVDWTVTHEHVLKQLPKHADDIEDKRAAEEDDIEKTYSLGYLARRPLRKHAGPVIFSWTFGLPLPFQEHETSPNTPLPGFRFEGHVTTLQNKTALGELRRGDYVLCPKALKMGVEDLDVIVLSELSELPLDVDGKPSACSQFQCDFLRDSVHRAVWDEDCKKYQGLLKDEPFRDVAVHSHVSETQKTQTQKPQKTQKTATLGDYELLSAYQRGLLAHGLYDIRYTEPETSSTLSIFLRRSPGLWAPP